MENMREENLVEKTVSSDFIFDGNLLKVYRDEVTLPNGKIASREYIKHNGAVSILPITEDGKAIVERQFRYPHNRVVTEIPAGKLDSPDEDHLSAAKRELEEETGLVADLWIPIGTIIPSVAYSTECIWMYIARGLHQGERHLDPDEFLNCEEIPLNNLVDMVMRGEISDCKTIASVLKAVKL